MQNNMYVHYFLCKNEGKVKKHSHTHTYVYLIFTLKKTCTHRMGKPAKNEVDYLQRVGENKRGHRKK